MLLFAMGSLAARLPDLHTVGFELPGRPPLSVSVLEVSDRQWWAAQSEAAGSNPFGAKVWPAALGVAEHLSSLPIGGWCDGGVTSALDCCCGNGLVSLTLGHRGVASVTATDISPVALELTSQAARAQQLDSITAMRFDLGSSEPLPAAELCVFADLFYDEHLGRLVANRVAEAAKRGSWVLVGSHVRSGRDAFLKRLSQLMPDLEPRPAFRLADERIVRSEALRWKEKRWTLLEFNTPEWAQPLKRCNLNV